MDISKLMIGDWVFNTHHKKPIRITRYDFFVHGHRDDGSQYLVASIPTSGRDIQPIPLSADILEKNGFEQDKKCPFVFNTDDEDVIIDLYDPDPRARLSKKEDYDSMVGVRLSPEPPYGFSYWGNCIMIRANYVHELQHALRICGFEKEIVL